MSSRRAAAWVKADDDIRDDTAVVPVVMVVEGIIIIFQDLEQVFSVLQYLPFNSQFAPFTWNDSSCYK